MFFHETYILAEMLFFNCKPVTSVKLNNRRAYSIAASMRWKLEQMASANMSVSIYIQTTI